METGYDIIFFWVARMIMLSLYNMRDFAGGDIPFETVYSTASCVPRTGARCRSRSATSSTRST